MKPANLSGAIDHVRMPVPRYRKGKGWDLGVAFGKFVIEP